MSSKVREGLRSIKQRDTVGASTGNLQWFRLGMANERTCFWPCQFTIEVDRLSSASSKLLSGYGRLDIQLFALTPFPNFGFSLVHRQEEYLEYLSTLTNGRQLNRSWEASNHPRLFSHQPRWKLPVAGSPWYIRISYLKIKNNEEPESSSDDDSRVRNPGSIRPTIYISLYS